MFTLRDRRTGELFDRWSYLGDKRRRLMEQSWAGVFRNHLLVELPVDDLCRHLDERMGRPSKDLHVVIGILLLQQLHDLSDAETVEALAFNMAWHYALDVRSEADSYFCEKILRNYRRLFIEQGLDELLFRCLTGSAGAGVLCRYQPPTHGFDGPSFGNPRQLFANANYRAVVGTLLTPKLTDFLASDRATRSPRGRAP